MNQHQSFDASKRHVLGHPLDTVRIRLQHGRTDSIQAIVRALLAKEGPRALFKGAAYPLLTVAIQVSLPTLLQQQAVFIKRVLQSIFIADQHTCMRYVVCLQSAVVFQAYGVACRAITGKSQSDAPLSYSQVCAAGTLSWLLIP